MPKLKRPQIIRHEDGQGYDVLLFGKDGLEHGWLRVKPGHSTDQGLMVWLFDVDKPEVVKISGQDAVFTVTRAKSTKKRPEQTPDPC